MNPASAPIPRPVSRGLVIVHISGAGGSPAGWQSALQHLWAITRRGQLTDCAVWCTIFGAMQIIFRDKKWELKGGITARDAIKKAGIDPESVLVVVNGKLVTDDTILRDTDNVKLVAVVSGGNGM